MAEKVDSNILMDRCWTLLPLSALSSLLSMLIVKNGAIFYVAFMDEFGISRQSATWPLTVHGVMAHLAGLLVILLQKKMPIYHIAVAGSFLNFSSLVAAAFVPNIVWMTVTMGIMGGSGCGMIVITLSMYTVLYFNKYRGAASGFKYTGMTLAPLAFPLALSALIRQFNVFGALLIISAVELNTLPIAMLMNKPRPVSLHCSKGFLGPLSKSCPKSYGTNVDFGSITGELQGTPILNSKASPLYPSQENTRNSSVTCAASGSFTGERASVPKAETELDTVFGAAKDNTEGKNNQFVSEILAQGVTVLDGTEDTTKRNHSVIPGFRESKGKMIGSNALAIGPHEVGTKHNEVCPTDDVSSSNKSQCEAGKLFRNPLLYLLVATLTISEYTMNTFEITVLDYTLDKGSPRSEAEPVIMYVAAAELLGRLTLPLLWDYAKLRRSILVALCLTVTAVSLAVLPHVTQFGHVVAVAVITGGSCGCVVALKPVLLSDHLGVQMLPLCWGLAGLAMIPFAFGGPFLIGLFRDKMGSYDNLYRMMSALCVAFAAMLLTSTFFEKRVH